MKLFRQSAAWIWLLALGGVVPSHAFNIVENGKSQTTIVVSPQASVTEKFAAQELRNYLQKISGVTLPLKNSPGTGRNILVGKSNVPLTTPVNNEAFAIQVRGNELRLQGASERSTLYAAYALLEKLGVKFFAPQFDFYQGHAEQVPSLKTIDYRGGDVRESPAYRYRRKYVEEGWSHTARTLPQLIDWMAKNRQNVLVYPYNYQNRSQTYWDAWRKELLPELQKRDIILQVGGHGYQSFLPPEKYAAQHPDWFIAGYNVFNIANEEALQTYIDNTVNYLKSRPEIRIFDAWPPDGAKWAPQVVAQFGGIPNAQAFVTNRLTDAIQRAGLDVQVENISYSVAVDAPDADKMYHPSTFIDFCYYGRSYRDLIFDSEFPQNKKLNALISQWKTNGFRGNIGIYEYYRKYAWHSLPVVLPTTYEREIPYYHSQGANGFGIYSEPADWITYEVTHALVAALSWDTNLKADQWLGDYLRSRYGNSAQELKQYFVAVEAASRALLHYKGAGDYDRPQSVEATRAAYLDAQKALQAAGAKAEDARAKFLIERLEWNLDYALANVDEPYYRQHKDVTKADAARARLQEIVEKHRLDGIILQNTYSVRRYQKALDDRETREAARERYYSVYHSAWK